MNFQDKIKAQEQIIEQALGIVKDRSERIGRGETSMDDCFVSDRSNQHTIREAKMWIELYKNDGLAEFTVLKDIETDEVVSEKTVNGQYGMCYLIKEDFRDKFGTFVGMAKQESTFTRKGLKEDTAMLPAKVKFVSGGGGGLYGAYTGQHVICQK